MNRPHVAILSEKTELDLISGISDNQQQQEFASMWYDDLMAVYNNKSALINAANTLLTYFACSNRVSDVDYDYESDCLLWEVQLAVA